MPSKQAKAKEAQGYNPKPTPEICCNCARYTSDRTEEQGTFRTYVTEKNRRCSKGGFAVKKTATCDEFEFPY